MSRTRKGFNWNSCFRSPRGRRNAIANKARKRAIPPDPYDDISVDEQCWLPMKIAKALAAKDMWWYDIRDHLMNKYGLSLYEAREVVESEMYGERLPAGYLKVYSERPHK